MLLLIEVLVTAVAVPFAFVMPSFGDDWFSLIGKHVRQCARRRTLAVLTVLVLALGARLIVLPVEPIPQPAVADEFSYLLMGDTFAHARLSNPTHPMWRHFETITVLQKPTYCSKYYPGQGLFLAFGQVALGHPFWGVWLSASLMCASICWALQGWVPPIWAFLGGVLTIVRLGTFSYWADSYWGGAVAAIGGALAIGALPRINTRRGIRDAIIMAFGLVLLAATRPFEGLFLSVPLLLVLLFLLTEKNAGSSRVLFFRLLLPFLLVLIFAAGGFAYYFWRTTGDPLRPPYLVDVATYFAVPNFPWLPLPPVPHYNHEVIRSLYTGPVVHDYEMARFHPIKVMINRLAEFWAFFLAPLLSLPLLMILLSKTTKKYAAFPSGKTKLFLALCAGCGIGNLLPVFYMSHYSAPMTCALYGVIVQSFRHLRLRYWKRQRVGVALVRMLLAACALLFLARIAAGPLHIPIPESAYHAWFTKGTQNLVRAKILRRLTNTPGSHLVIVRYSCTHDVQREWVYNAADIDRSKVVWAHDMGGDNQELLRYFEDRHAWLLEADTDRGLIPYDTTSLATK